ncbi:MAG TPA: hypothetical protein PLA54_08470 [Spirochaetota bacterium]|nr:hypothetical protein [Spirochaetota bacterium]
MKNITIDQIIETLKDENKRKQIEEIICDDKSKGFEEDIFIRSNYYITYDSRVEADHQKEYSLKDSEHYNHFENEKEAIMIAKKQNAEKKLYHISKYLNKGWKPDWKSRENKFYIFYNHYNRCYRISCDHIYDQSHIYFKSSSMFPVIRRLMGEQSLKDYFMLEY